MQLEKMKKTLDILYWEKHKLHAKPVQRITNFSEEYSFKYSQGFSDEMQYIKINKSHFTQRSIGQIPSYEFWNLCLVWMKVAAFEIENTLWLTMCDTLKILHFPLEFSFRHKIHMI